METNYLNRNSISNFTHELIHNLKTLELGISDKEDTKRVKETIAKIAVNNNYNVWASRLEKKTNNESQISGKEWLYDLICYKFKNGCHYSLNETILVMESEWGGKRFKVEDADDPYGEVKFDFQKLLISNAFVKLMVYRQHKADFYAHGNKDLYSYFQNRIDNNIQITENSIFIFAEFSYKKEGKRRCRLFSYSKNGEWKEY